MVQEYIRPYEISIWTLQDEFVTVLKWSEIENKGQIQSGELELVDDGTEKLTFSVPLWYYDNGKKIKNPLWHDFHNNRFIVNMHKIKLIFNKKTADESVFEFLITKIDEAHDKNEVIYDITCEGLAFHELGKIGYKISLNADDFIDDWTTWFNDGQVNEAPVQNIQYWNDKVFKFVDINGRTQWKYKWTYELQMDWSSFSHALDRDPHTLYEEEYVSSWETLDNFLTLPRQIEGYREKWRPVNVEESNIYNITQTIAETFGVFCKYKYDYDDNYHIIGRRVIYYNNFIHDVNGHIDFTYPYSTSSITRSLDNTDTITKLYVRPVDASSDTDTSITIMNVEANKSKEDYILNFDYLHNMHTITDEQYNAISQYEATMRMYNNELLKLEQQIAVLENNCITEEANITLYTNALALDEERYNNANALRAQLTGNNNYIEYTDANPQALMLKTDPSSNSLRYVDISLEGVIPSSVNLYQTINYTKTPGSGERLQNLYTGGKYQYDEFGNLNRISNIYIGDSTIRQLYMTCNQIPTLYYDNVVHTWEVRRYKDAQALEKAKERLYNYYMLLRGGDVDYARVDEAKTDYSSTIFGAIVDDPGTILTDNGPKIGEGHGYLYTYQMNLQEKQEAILQFDRLMGPALREGYWQPDDYNDYGDKYLDSYTISYTDQTTSGNTAFASFTWDTEAFEDETELAYYVGAEQNAEYYLLVDLSDCLHKITGNLHNLSFIYYDENIKTTAEMDRARRAFTVGSKAQFGFVYNTTKRKYIPVLVVLGSSELTATQIQFIKTNSTYKPFLGTIESIYDTSRKLVIPKVNNIHDNLKFVNINEVGINSSKKHCLCYPRIKISSLSLKNDPNEILLSSNGSILKMYDDFYVLLRTDQSAIDDSYYITIKPENILRNGNQSTTLSFSYALSNADVSIYLDALEVMKENSTPKVSYTIDLSILNKEFIHTAYNKLNHIVHINDYELEFHDINGYISSIKLSLDTPDNDSVEVKNYATKFEDLFSTIVAQTEAMKKNANVISLAQQVIGTNGLLSASVLQQSMLKVDLNYAFNNGKLTIDEKNGIWGVSDAGVVAFRGGGIFTATEKDDAGNWKWNTGILPTGINADLITTGQLDTNKIKIYAGDKVKFQLNGEGLFAYKSLFSDGVITNNLKGTEYIKDKTGASNAEIANSDIDASQYVTFNENGLFLIAKRGALVLNQNKTDYIKVGENDNTITEVRRVEISWNGLILRNWANQDVFFAESDTGNLRLKGHIESSSGTIGGWGLSPTALTGTYMQFVNDTANNSGIFLTRDAASSAQTLQYNNHVYYAYIIGNNTSKIYYYSQNQTTHTVTSGDSIYEYGTRISSVSPKYLTYETFYVKGDISSSASGADSGSETMGSFGNTVIIQGTQYTYTKAYVATSNNGTAIKYNGNKIEYNGDNSSNAVWYAQLVAAGYSNYANVNRVQTTELVKASLSNGTVLKLATYTPTFKVMASTGEVTISKGTLGSFTLTSTELLNGTLKNTTLTNSTITSCNIKIGDKTYATNDYGYLFKEFTPNSGAGQFTLTRVNGSTVTFNIADTTYFRSAVSAARVITLDLSIKNSAYNSSATATATTPGFGAVSGYTATKSISLAPVYRSGYNAGKKKGKEEGIEEGIKEGKQSVTIKSVSIYGDPNGSGYTAPVQVVLSNGVSDIKSVPVSVYKRYAAEEVTATGATMSVGTKLTEAQASQVAITVSLSSGRSNSTTITGGGNIWKSGYNKGLEEGKKSIQLQDLREVSYTSDGTKWIYPTGNNVAMKKVKVKIATTCFIGGTQVLLANGQYKSIENLCLHDKLLSYDEKDKQYKETEVISNQVLRRKKQMIDIYLSNGEIVCATDTHPLLTNDGWKAINAVQANIEYEKENLNITNLKIGDQFISPENEAVFVIDIKMRSDLNNEDVYNIDTEPYDTYIVHGIVAHNKEPK